MSFGRRFTPGGTGVLVLMVMAAGAVAAGAADEPRPRVVFFNPQGTVKGARQVTARFSAAMVPFGDPRDAAEPFVIDCPERGKARWIDSRNWSYDFERDLPAGIRCRFELRSGLKALDGTPLGGDREFRFSTGGPAIRSSQPWEGAGAIDEEQAFVLTLDAEATTPSIRSHVSFYVEGLPERIGVRIVEGASREEILKSLPPPTPRQPQVVIKARQRFPNHTRVSLIWGKGVTTKSGVATEQDQVLPFVTRKKFVATFHCTRENPRAACVPVTPMSVVFSAPVLREKAREIVLIGPAGERRPAEALEGEAPFVHRAAFAGPFPEATTFRIELPADLRDDAGRELANADRYPLEVKTGPFPPLAKFAARFGIVERNAGPALPVTLRNLEPEVKTRLLTVGERAGPGMRGRMRRLLGSLGGKIWRIPPARRDEIVPWLRKVAYARRDSSIFGDVAKDVTVTTLALPKPNGARPFEVVGIPLEEPGLYVVEIESSNLGAALLGKEQPMYVPAAALVTNLSVHFKWARESSLAWVTTLDRARTVAGARVEVHDCHGKVLWEGETDRDGIARIGELPDREVLPRCSSPNLWDIAFFDFAGTQSLRSLENDLFVTATKDDDLTFVHSSWDDGIESWRFGVPSEDWHGPIAARTVFDRPLFRAGETAHMKHWLRKRTLGGFSFVPESERPNTVSIRHLGSDEKYELRVAWDAAGIAETAWQIPKEAKLGSYQVVMLRSAEKPREREAVTQEEEETTYRPPFDREWVSGEIRVEEFRVPLMKAAVKLPPEPQVAVSEVPIDVAIQYLAGGGAGGLPVKVRSQVQPASVPSFEGFEGFVFANGTLAEGVTRRGLYERYAEDEEEEGREAPGRPGVHQRAELQLDAAGTGRATITKLPRAKSPQQLLAEVEFRDPNGELQTTAARVTLWPSRRLIGVKADSWAASKESVRATVAVADVSGKPVAGASVRVEVLERKVYSHRKRMVGGFYAYEHVEETRRVGELCRGTTNEKGVFPCEGKPPADGELILQASLGDGEDAPSAWTQVWVAGSRQWWFRVQDSDRIDLLPEKRRYEPGETARLQVRMPFPRATGLLAVEREGVLEARVVRLSGKKPVVEVPVAGNFAPNMFVSLLVVRGRSGGVQPTATIDLGKPAYKLGVAELEVGWRAHELRVSVAAERETYRVREQAKVAIAVRTAEGKAPPAGSEVAVAAVDEGLLELLPNESWQLLEAMMGRRGYGVRTATAHMQVIGKRHYGLKAVAHGGGGGRKTTRELFDTLLLWRGRVPLDAGGRAVIEVPLNDSLTAFRIVAVATGGVGLFGTGAATIRTTQDLMLLAGLPPLVREGDRFRPEVTVRNTTGQSMEVTLRGRAEEIAQPFRTETVRLEGGEAKTVGWDLTVPEGVVRLRYEIDAAEKEGATDRVKVTQQVASAVPVRTFQATLARWEERIEQPVEIPKDAIAGRGGVTVTLAPTLLHSLDGVRDWMTRYPYTCLEQRVSRAVALRDDELWSRVVALLPSHLDGDGLLKYFPAMLWGSDTLTSYVLAVAHEAGWEIPENLASRMKDGLRRFVDGTLHRWSLPTVDLSIRKLAAIEALSRYEAADSRLLGTFTIEPNLWPTSAVLDWWNLLSRLPAVPDRDQRLDEAEAILRSRLNLQGTTMGFSTERGDNLWWLMVCPDTNPVRLVLSLLEGKRWNEDLPRVVRGALGRQQRGSWDCTTSNAWGVLAVEKFASAFEATPITGATTVGLAGEEKQVEWPPNPEAGKPPAVEPRVFPEKPPDVTLDFAWPPALASLTIDHAGTGNPWVTIASRAAIPLRAPLSSGYRIRKSLTPVEQRQAGRWSRGDIVRVRVSVEAQSDMTWVVVNDPVPAGASHLGSGLGRDSGIAVAGEKWDRWYEIPAFEERAFEAFRAYYEYVPKGSFDVEYTIRLNQDGRFRLPTTRVEALYAPEMFGELPNEELEVEP